MKVVGQGEKEEFLMKVILQIREISDPFLSVKKLIQVSTQYLILFIDLVEI